VNDIKENDNGKEDLDSRPPIRSRTGFTGMTLIKRGFTGQAEKETGMTKNFFIIG
jgi:hypothetical protein